MKIRRSFLIPAWVAWHLSAPVTPETNENALGREADLFRGVTPQFVLHAPPSHNVSPMALKIDLHSLGSNLQQGQVLTGMSQAVNAADLMWDFFSLHPMP